MLGLWFKMIKIKSILLQVGSGLWVYSAHIDKDCHMVVNKLLKIDELVIIANLR